MPPIDNTKKVYNNFPFSSPFSSYFIVVLFLFYQNLLLKLFFYPHLFFCFGLRCTFSHFKIPLGLLLSCFQATFFFFLVGIFFLLIQTESHKNYTHPHQFTQSHVINFFYLDLFLALL